MREILGQQTKKRWYGSERLAGLHMYTKYENMRVLKIEAHAWYVAFGNPSTRRLKAHADMKILIDISGVQNTLGVPKPQLDPAHVLYFPARGKDGRTGGGGVACQQSVIWMPEGRVGSAIRVERGKRAGGVARTSVPYPGEASM